MENRPNKDLAISAASKIFEKVTTALGKLDADKRWFWELLQNAKDTVVYRPGQELDFNEPNKKIDVILSVSKTIDGETILKFTHNGNPFRASNHEYKYDDPKCILLADSGKIEEDESMRGDLTGQFGSGFLSTHVLTPKIMVDGIFHNGANDFFEFKFTLDRNFKNKLDLPEKVEKSLDEYTQNFHPINEPKEFITSFTYYLDENINGLESAISMVKNGIDGINIFIPYVFAFCNEIRSLKVIDNVINNTTITYSRNITESNSTRKFDIINIIKEVEFHQAAQQATKLDLFVCKINSPNHINLACQLTKVGDCFEIILESESSPMLYCTFPLIGSEQWRFPVVINCNNFYPEVERNGINLLPNKDHGNIQLIEEARLLFIELTTILVTEKFKNTHLLANTNYEVCPAWCDPQWYDRYLNTLREDLLNKEIVINYQGEPKKLRDAKFPNCNGETNLATFWEICKLGQYKNIPSYNILETWNIFLNVNNSNWKNLKLGINEIVLEIQQATNLQTLSANRFNQSEENCLEWLNSVYDFIQNNLNKKHLLEDYKIVLDQENNFKSLNTLFFDQNIPEVLKKALDDLGEGKRGELIHNHLRPFSSHTPFTVKNASTILNELFQSKTKRDLPGFTKAMHRLYACQFEENDHRHRTIFEFSNLFLFEQNEFEMKIEPEMSEIYWSNIDKWIIERIATKLEMSGSVENLMENLKLFSVKECIKEVDSFLIYLNNNEEFIEILSKYAIFPNELGNFKKRELLFNDIENIPEELKNIFAQLSKGVYNWKENIIDPSIKVKANQDITLKAFTSQLDDNLKISRDNLEDQDIRKALINLVKWVKDNESAFNIADLFKWFALNKANMVLNILEDISDRDNVFTIIQSGRPLNIIAQLVESSLTNEQINQLIADPIKTQKLLDQIKFNDQNDTIINQDDLIKRGIFYPEQENEFNLFKKTLNFKSHNFNSGNWEYVKMILMRSFKNVLEHLKKDSRYEFTEEVLIASDPITPTVISGVLKDGIPINLVIRPSDGEKVYVYYGSEFKALLLENTEFWIDNGKEPPELLTIGKILKYTHTEIIPLTPQHRLN